MSNFVMVVDDNPSDLLLTSTHVESEGYEVVQATDGYVALDKIDEQEYKLFVVDLQMPRMNGIELIKRIRRIKEFEKTPILVTSARKEAKDVKMAIQMGASDYLVKPLDGLVFQEKFRRIIGDKVRWKDYEIDPSLPESLGYIQKSVRFTTVSEVEVSLMSSDPYVEGETIEFGGGLFTGETDQVLTGQVISSEKKGEEFLVKLSFVGVNKTVQKKIRLFCREIWAKSRQESSQEEG